MEFLRGLQVAQAPLKKPLPKKYTFNELQKKDISIVPGKYYFPDENRHDYTYSMFGPPNDPTPPHRLIPQYARFGFDYKPNYVPKKYYEFPFNIGSKIMEKIYAQGETEPIETQEIFLNEIFIMDSDGLQTSTQATRY